MKTIILNILQRRILYTAIAIFAIFSLGSCAKKIVFPVSSVLPAASASVTIKKDKNGNYAINLDVKHMASPNRLEPARKVYVVWIDTSQKGTENMGRISISKSLKGSLRTSTPFKPMVVFITAEDDANVKYPGMQVVLRSNFFEL